MLKHNKELLKNYIKELKASKRKDNSAFVYVIYNHNFNSGILEGFLYIFTLYNAVKVRLKDYESVSMIQEGLSIPFVNAEDMEAPDHGKILSGYYKRFKDGKGGFQQVKAEDIPDIKISKEYFENFGEFITELKDTRKIQLSLNDELLRIFTSKEEGGAEVKHYIKNEYFQGLDMNNFCLLGRKDPSHRPMILKSEELSPEYVITPVRYQE